jgi:hypothetical protein
MRWRLAEGTEGPKSIDELPVLAVENELQEAIEALSEVFGDALT